MKNIFLRLPILLFTLAAPSLLWCNSYKITFQVAAKADKETIGIRGNIPPLSWEQSILLTDDDKNGIFSTTITFDTDLDHLEYKFIKGENDWELKGSDNRILILKQEIIILPVQRWNEYLPMSKAQKEALVFTKAQLLEDFKILKEAYSSLHPALNRYNTEAQTQANFDALELELQQSLTLEEAYLAFTKFAATIKCGHTYVNHWNQSKRTKSAFHYQRDKVPFTFKLVNNRMIVTHDVSEKGVLAKVEVIAINGTEIQEIIDTLMPYVKGDGANNGQRLHQLQLNGVEKYEFFDLYFPILFPPTDGTYSITYNDILKDKRGITTVKAISRNERKNRLMEQVEGFATSPEDTWRFEIVEDNLAVLTIGTFSIWNFKMDYKAFIRDAFKEVKEKNIENLVLDIRNNGGGADEVSAELAMYLLQEDVILEGSRSLLKYDNVPEHLRPYLGTWDKSFYDISKKVKPDGNGNFTWKNSREKGLKIKSRKTPYKFTGNFYVIAHEANSSATYFLTKMVKETNIGTVVGQETGGNQKGITGGFMFFLTLPNTQIELDIPLGANIPLTEKRDGGILPDVYVQPSVDDTINGVDTEMEAIKKLINNIEP